MRLDERGEPTGAEAVRIELTRTGEIARMGGPPELLSLIGCVPTAANGPYYARIVRERAIAPGPGGAAGTRIAQLGHSADPDVSEILAAAEAALWEAAGDSHGSGTAAWLSDAVYEVIEQLGQPMPLDQVTPPYADLRDMIPALRPGQLITIAARPSIGKTLVAGDFARHAALKLGLPVAWFTLEMSRQEIIIRCISAEARVNHEHLQRRTLDDAEWQRVADAAKVFGESRMLIDEKGGASLAHVSSALRVMQRTAMPALVVFDYIQLGSSPGAASRQEEVSRLARGLQGHRHGLRRARPADGAAQPQPGVAGRQAPPPGRPARVRGDRELQRHRDPAAPRGLLRARVASGRRDGPDRHQEPQRPARPVHGHVPGPVLPLHGPGARQLGTHPVCDGGSGGVNANLLPVDGCPYCITPERCTLVHPYRLTTEGAGAADLRVLPLPGLAGTRGGPDGRWTRSACRALAAPACATRAGAA